MNKITEIYIQPELWLKVYSQILRNKVDTSEFLKKLLTGKNYTLILPGAKTIMFNRENPAPENHFQQKKSKQKNKVIIV